MPLGWETNTVESESLRGKSELGMGNSRAPHPLYETLLLACTSYITTGSVDPRLLFTSYLAILIWL